MNEAGLALCKTLRVGSKWRRTVRAYCRQNETGKRFNELFREAQARYRIQRRFWSRFECWWDSGVNSVLWFELASHYNDVIIRAMASQITSASIVYSTVCSGANQRKHQSPASLAFVREIQRWPVNSPHKGSVTRKVFPFHGVIMDWRPLIASPRTFLKRHLRINMDWCHSIHFYVIIVWWLIKTFSANDKRHV